MADVPWAEVAGVFSLTVQITVLATLVGAAIGVPLGAFIGLRRGVARSALRTIVFTFYGLPPVVAGLVLYLLLSRAGPLGFLGLLFTPWAIVLAEVLLAAPLIAGLTIAALAEVPPAVREAVRAAGASPALFRFTMIREARYGVLAAIMVGFGRALAEVAAALIVGGNIRHETRTLGTAIVQEVSQGNYAFALTLAALLLAVALVTFFALHKLQSTQAVVKE